MLTVRMKNVQSKFQKAVASCGQRTRTMSNYGVILHVSTEKTPTIKIHVQCAWVAPRALLAELTPGSSVLHYTRVFVQLH